MEHDLKTLITSTNSRVLGQVLGKSANKPLLDWILEESRALDAYTVTIVERIWYILNNKPNPCCAQGFKRTFKPKTKSYGFCGNIAKCSCFRDHQSHALAGHDMTQVIEKRRKTWLEKYGVDNASKADSVKSKRKKTMLDRDYSQLYQDLSYQKQSQGFDQVIDRVSDIVEPLFDRQNYHGSQRHNVYSWRCLQCENEFTSHIDYGTNPRCLVCYPKTVSKSQKEIADFVGSLVPNVIIGSKQIIPPRELDIYVPEKNLAIEYNGIYWHSADKKSRNY